MGCRTNTPPGEKHDSDWIPGFLFITVLLIILFIGMIFTQANTCPEKWTVKTEKFDEVVKEITYQYSTWNGKYCIVVTDKDFYTMRRENCINNKVGEPLTNTYGEYVEACGDNNE